jgi:hypothetical protein
VDELAAAEADGKLIADSIPDFYPNNGGSFRRI